MNDKDEERISPYTGTESMVQHFTATKNVYGTIREPPTLKTPDDLTHLPSLQALHILKIQLKAASILGDVTRITIIPTALQQLIPHDVRIDYIPSPSLRDRMILFQDYYDPEEVFELLSTKTKFIGGDTRDSRNWVPDPKFSERYWFLSHQLVDYHSGEGALIPEFIDAIIASQREKETKMKRLKKEKEEQERLRKEETNAKKPSNNNNNNNHTTTTSNNSTSTTSTTTNSTLSSISLDSNNRARRPPISSVRKERSSNIRSLPLDL
ncbi:hypothetical protein BDC45DRAFT_493477 [Circinella umbellata]|nr:hypothetical protein BDC45DRAFT_493477 [Circinella umbellata]